MNIRGGLGWLVAFPVFNITLPYLSIMNDTPCRECNSYSFCPVRRNKVSGFHANSVLGLIVQNRVEERNTGQRLTKDL